MKKIVVIGGGTGTFTVLRGLKNYSHEITAVVTMFDSGGSSGVLRDEHGVLPPGDVRRCLVALSEGEQEKTLRKLFNYRFDTGASLKGHSFGNILITALTEIFGSEDVAINEAGAILNIKGKVMPVSLDKSHLCVELEDGTEVKGETNIDVPKHDGSLHIKRVYLDPEAKAFPEVISAIHEADVVVLGPGDLYTSIIPNLVVQGIPEALQESKAKKVYILNLFTKWGETNGYSASDFAKEILRYSGLEKLDYVICNTNKREIPKDILQKYAKEKKYPIEIDEGLKECAQKVVVERLSRADYFLRHNSKALAKAIDDIV